MSPPKMAFLGVAYWFLGGLVAMEFGGLIADTMPILLGSTMAGGVGWVASVMMFASLKKLQSEHRDRLYPAGERS